MVQVIAGSSKQALVAPVQNISKNGYLYIYVSNESPQNLYFDNVTVKQITGPLQQEQSYYPHGLPMAGISDKQLLKQITPYKANGGVELEEDYGLQTYNTDFKKYDPQIGRFNGVDALAELTGDLTPYQFGANDPVFWNDPSGLSLAAPARPNQGVVSAFPKPVITPTAFPTGSGSYSLPFSSGDPDESGSDNNESSSGGGGESNSGGDESASGGGFVNSGIGFNVGYWGDGGGGESGGSFSLRIIGRSRDRRNSEDMNTTGTPSDINSKHGNRSNFELSYWMTNLFNTGTCLTNNAMGKVASKMLNRFLNKEGGVFTDNDLNNEIATNETFMEYLIGFDKRFKNALLQANGDINRVPILSTTGPIFGYSHTLTGLAITIDAFNFTEITLTGFAIDKSGNYSAALSFYMEDAFGLDRNDVFSKGFIHPGFESWWLLQHTRGYLPFKTIVQLSTNISGNINNP